MEVSKMGRLLYTVSEQYIAKNRSYNETETLEYFYELEDAKAFISTRMDAYENSGYKGRQLGKMVWQIPHEFDVRYLRISSRWDEPTQVA
jgi:hypothetical protein